ncbi:MAG TPA: EAL domain-containing protein, partial [Jatrophihabitans sp.]|nr:EAL domain-containing protein [Jatrophihabitans sp.]
CLLRLAFVKHFARGSSQVFPPGLDLCTYPGIGPELRRDTADDSIGVVPASLAASGVPDGMLVGAAATLARSAFIVAPVYGSASGVGTRPVLGWITTWFDAGRVIADATRRESRLTVSVSHRDRSGHEVVLATRHGSHPYGQRTTVTIKDTDGRWRITVSGSLASGLSAATQGWFVAGGGSLLTLLLVFIVVLLRASRVDAAALAYRRTAQMHHHALHDALTGLPNRALIIDRATLMLSRARREQTQIAALFIDLDNFKDINDTLGYSAGDELLKAVARRLASAVRDTDTVGRLGGDEFVVLAEGPSVVAGPELVAERVLDPLYKPFHIEGRDAAYRLTASIGLAVGAFESTEELLRNADVALHEAKAAGKDTFAVFEQAMQDQVDRRLGLEMDLREAVDEHQFFLVYQPTFDISRGTVRGAEALLRWQHPTDGLIGPDEFVPLLERNGLIVPVGRWVLFEACRHARRCADAGYPISMAVNVSPRQLTGDGFVADVDTAMRESGIDPRLLVLEITEATLMRDTPAAIARLEQLKALGVQLAIDDFGTGYSSLAYLRQFPVDILKIDRMFVDGLADGDESTVVVHSLVQLGKTLGLQVVAEGIESHHQLVQLQLDECDIGQGYLYSRPLTREQFTAFLVDQAAAQSSTDGLAVTRPGPAR